MNIAKGHDGACGGAGWPTRVHQQRMRAMRKVNAKNRDLVETLEDGGCRSRLQSTEGRVYEE